MFVRKISGKKTLFLFANSRMTKAVENEKNIEVVVTSKKIFEKFKTRIEHSLTSKVKIMFIK
ncbi:hypothetical protein ACFL0J_08455 [Candidatus Neomarinimicrobiota bacterium]